MDSSDRFYTELENSDVQVVDEKETPKGSFGKAYKQIKYPVTKVYPVNTGYKFKNISSPVLEFFEAFRDAKEEEIDFANLWNWIQGISLDPVITDTFNKPLDVQIDPGHDASGIYNVGPIKPGPGSARPAALKQAKGTVFLYDATQEDISELIVNNDVARCYYLAFAEEGKYTVTLKHSDPRFTPLSSICDLYRPPEMSDEEWAQRNV